ncbi:zinc finger BED domain-containing protein RICESLEEPER 2-like [Coffea arabica]|uniref:Zinc finger BED domain-containing protein RICESLEEPER 2-like n=1 Tax=Coffea arabica TaxID=13443 RepID=A0ABM4VME6_COFAR
MSMIAVMGVIRATYKRFHLAVWPHFHRLEPDEHGGRKAICKTCGKKCLADNMSDTSNLLRHLASHAHNEEQPTGLAMIDHEIYRDKMAITIDIVTRWNSTYLMLERALLFRHAFSRLQDVDDDYKLSPLEEEWQRVDKIAEFLRPFYDVTLLFSGSKYPTANLYFPNVSKIQCLLNKEANSPDFLNSEMASNVKTKFQKYWDCYTVILSFAIILDPHYKLQFVEYCFFVLDPQSRDEKVLSIKQKLFRLFEEYSRTNTAITAIPMEGTFNGDDGQTRDLMDGFDVYQSQQGANGNKSELELCLEERLVDRKQQPDLNSWWENSWKISNFYVAR